MSFVAKLRATSVVLAVLLLVPTLVLRDTKDASDGDTGGAGPAIRTHALAAGDAAGEPSEHGRSAQGAPPDPHRSAERRNDGDVRQASGSAPSVPPGLASAGDDPECDEDCQADLASAWAATERYWEQSVAVRDGFVEATRCGSVPAGSLGIEYVHPARGWDQDIAAEQPESLVYMPEGFARMGRRLAALEYSVPVLRDGVPHFGIDAPDPARIQDPPELFGRRFSGPAPAPLPGHPWRYSLRVWLYSPNPAGTFAEANPAEACTGADHVAPDAVEDSPDGSLPEVFAVFFVDADEVRETLGIPAHLELRPATNGDPKQTELIVGVRQREWSTGDGPMVLTNIAMPIVPLRGPDWTGDPFSPFVDLYPFEWVTDNATFASWTQEGMGVGGEAIRHGTGFVGDYTPLVGVEPNYRVRTPDFVLEATFPEPAPTDGQSSNVRLWREGRFGMALVTLWHDSFRAHLGATVAEVTPEPGTVLALLLGCDPQAEACETRRSDWGVVVDFRAPSAMTVTASTDRWNPRHTGAR